NRKDASLRQQIIQIRKNRFLRLAGVLRAADEHQPPFQIENNKGVTAGLVAAGIGTQVASVEYRQLGLKAGVLFRRQAQAQIVRKQGVPGLFRDNADRKPIGRIGTSSAIENEQLTALKMPPDFL